MIGRLIRQEGAFDQMHISQILALCTSVALLLIPGLPQQFARFASKTQGLGFVPIYALICALLIFFVVTTNIGQRCSRLSLVLPIPARKLWLVRIASIIIVSLIPVAIVTFVATLSFRGVEGRIPEAVAWKLGMHTGAGMILAAMLLQSFSPKLYRVGWRAGYILYTLAVSFGVLGLLVVGMRSALYSVLFIAAAVILTVRVYRLLPQSFLLLPKRPEKGKRAAIAMEQRRAAAEQVQRRAAAATVQGKWMIEEPAQRSVAAEPRQRTAAAALDTGMREVTGTEEGVKSIERAAKSPRAVLHRTCFRLILGHWQVWLSLALLGFYATMLVLSYHEGKRDNPYPLFMIIWIAGPLISAIYNVHKIDFLPISRKIVFAYAFGSAITVMLLGFVIGNAIVAADRTRFKQLGFNRSTVHIPEEFWEITTDGEAPVLSSPWGETYAPEAYPLYRGSSIIIYKPYDCGRESSDRFVAMQTDRAAAAVYGAPFDPTDRYEDLAESNESGARACCAAIDQYAGRGSPVRLKSFATGAILFALFYIILFWVTLRSSRTTGRRSVVQQVIVISVILIFSVAIVVIAAGSAGVTHTRAVAAVSSILTRKLSETIPLHTPALWVIFVALCIAGYLAIQSEFMKMEAPVQRQKPFLGDY